MPGGYRSAVHMDSTQSMMPQHLAPRMQEWCPEHNSNLDQHQHKSAWTASGNGSWTDTQRQNYDFNSNGQNCTSNNNFQLNVLTKLDKIIAKQEEHSLLLRRLLQTREEDTGPENPILSIGQLPDLLSFEDKLRVDEELQRKTGQ